MSPRELLDTMLGYLGFVVDIQESTTPGGTVLQIFSADDELLIGPHGERLQDIQYLLNRLLQAEGEDSEKVTVDIGHYRSMQQDGLMERVRQKAETVRATGRSVMLDPMNSFDRRMVHNLFKDDPDIEATSQPGDRRLKSMTLRTRYRSDAPQGPQEGPSPSQ